MAPVLQSFTPFLDFGFRVSFVLASGMLELVT